MLIQPQSLQSPEHLCIINNSSEKTTGDRGRVPCNNYVQLLLAVGAT